MDILGPVIAGGSAILGGALSSGDSKGATYVPSSTFMPPTMKAAYENAFLQAMSRPSSFPISYGGQSYSIPRMEPAQAAAMYAQSLQPVMTQTAQPSPLSGAMTALAGVMPYMSGATGGGTNLLPYNYNMRPYGPYEMPYGTPWGY